MKKIAFFDAKEYDKPSFESFGEQYGLKVESVEDEGTTVTIRLPRTKGGEAG